MSSVFLVCCSVFSVIIRFRVIDSPSKSELPGIILVVFLTSAIHGFQLRFVHTAITLLTIFVCYIAIHTIQDTESDIVVLIALMISFLTLVLFMRENEAHERDNMVKRIKSNQMNTNLMRQLKSINRKLSSFVVDLESPLDKAIGILKTLLQDSSLSSEQFKNLELIVKLLSSPEIFTPDFDSQIQPENEVGTHNIARHGSIAIDPDQRKWLFSEVTKKRHDSKMTKNLSHHQRKSILITNCEELPEKFIEELSASSKSASPLKKTASLGSEALNEQKNFDRRFSANSSSVSLEGRQTIENVQRILQNLNDWNFNIFSLADNCPKHKPLFIVFWKLMEINSLFQILGVSKDKFTKFVLRIQEGYNDLPCKKYNFHIRS